MIPPCDPSVLEHNPKFKRLYENLTLNILNPDGSTRVHSADPARTVVAEDLKQCQIRSSKRRIKERILKQLAFASDSGIPDECHDNLAIISLYLETPSPVIEPEPLAPAPATDENENENKNTDNTALSLLVPDFETFYNTIPTLSRQLSTLLLNSIAELRSLSSDDEPSNEPPSSRSTSATHHARTRARDKRLRTSMAPVKPLSTHLADQVAYLRQRQLFELPTARRAMAATAAQLLAVQTVVLERLVVVLERGMHGALARRIKARADHLGTVARGVEGKAEVTKLEIAAMLYTPETLAALGRYRAHLRELRDRLDQRGIVAKGELKKYGDVGEFEVGEGSGSDGGDVGGDCAAVWGVVEGG
ncbi:hypothetical protein N7481_003165 [Penicillium waksmanii]|uniref:uncharacterized protein n=1 Tax=Penicillium waksmanii TaxID=69791 RepID=UPI00254954A8|nr:uncharacterized protein N7481_003165 [Penicillium waksmanii]KAJ5987955.1 hypothetical protein N7481_003165 [Penicillium waksmanii]